MLCTSWCSAGSVLGSHSASLGASVVTRNPVGKLRAFLVSPVFRPALGGLPCPPLRLLLFYSFSVGVFQFVFHVFGFRRYFPLRKVDMRLTLPSALAPARVLRGDCSGCAGFCRGRGGARRTASRLALVCIGVWGSGGRVWFSGCLCEFITCVLHPLPRGHVPVVPAAPSFLPRRMALLAEPPQNHSFWRLLWPPSCVFSGLIFPFRQSVSSSILL